MLWSFPKLTSYPFFNVTRRLSTKSSPKNEPKYTHTINLPKTKFPARLTGVKRNEVHEQLRQTRFSKLYEWQRNSLPNGGEFTLHDGPPYANGDLHMGHAVNKILKDLILRHKIVSGTKVHYVPGWDCHGLPIELKALDAYSKSAKSKNLKEQLNASKIRRLARSFALETIDTQRTEFEQWGVTADWSESRSWYRTLDPGYIKVQLKLFQELFEKGLIYRDLKPVFWSPSSRSALAEAELEYDEAHKSPSLYLRFNICGANDCKEIRTRLESGEPIAAAIWTTTPWTLPANQAVCYNPNLRYCLVRCGDVKNTLLLTGSDLVPYLSEQFGAPLQKVVEIAGSELGCVKYEHPIDGSELPFLPAGHVKAEKGTGLVHTAPAHGPDDFLVFLERRLPIKSLIDESGCYNVLSPEFLQGKFALTEGNQLVLERLQEQTIACGTIEHSYPIDWRTKQPVMLRASEQWFIDTNKLKEPALAAVEEIRIFPRTSAEVSKKVLNGQLQKRPYWCISRQRAWGVPIPVFYDKKCSKPIIHSGIIEHLVEKLEKTGNMDFWWTAEIGELVPDRVLAALNLASEDLTKGEDILDIWFDSGISWLSVLGRERTADLYLEGLDQFTGWFQSSLLTSVATRGASPYRTIFVHGFAVDENGMKMSKSLGNIIQPKEIVNQYGCDTLRWWVAAHAIQNTSIPVSHKLLSSSGESVQKIRGILRFLLGVVPDLDVETKLTESNLKLVDKYFLQQLQQLHDTVFTLYESYQYNKASASTLTFCVSTLSGFYLHLIKDRLYCGTHEQYRNLQGILGQTFETLCKILWPIVPFLVEESWSYRAQTPFFEFSQRMASANRLEDSPHTAVIIEQVLDLKGLIFRQQQQQQLDANPWLLAVDADVPISVMQLLQTLQPVDSGKSCADSDLCEILQVGAVCLREVPAESVTVTIRKLEATLCPRCRRFIATEHVCQRCSEILKTKFSS
ncbi:isoleucine--tRNA ligase, mitochondrial [Sabethes cyaneus]|uniref:isoleucine--tRNA ligase, mitochondrial n=1 Tax=Sabethes cyaneus TaxID=53552 RepID=UPI00237E0DC9|nr:isoleucine--tRNA ligase, mitochondrial [Sabethes cyaneus]